MSCITKLAIALAIGMCCTVKGQYVEPKPESGISFQAFSYPMTVDNQIHASMMLNYNFSEKMRVRLGGYYDTYILENRFRMALDLKRYITKKTYLLLGADLEWRQGQSLINSKSYSRFGLNFGVGHEVQENFLIEAKGNFGMNKNAIGPYGESLVPMQQVYTLGGKLRF